MRKWVVWCIKHRMSWVVHLAMILSIPLFVGVGVYAGVRELAGDWLRDWKEIRRSAAAAQKGE